MSAKTRFEYTGGLAAFTSGYMECALWSSTDESTPEGGEPLDTNYGVSDIASETSARMESDCADFVAAQSALLTDWNASQAGHDFWLTRNRHGAGFWDRGRGANGDALTAAAHACGEVYLCVGDDGLIYSN